MAATATIDPHTAAVAGLAGECPAFKDGCPYKQTDSADKMAGVTASMPESHTTPGTSASTAVAKAAHALGGPAVGKCPIKGVDLSEAGSLFEVLEQVAQEFFNPPLSKQLKQGTHSSHRQAETGAFISRLLRGEVTKDEYRFLLVDLLHVYEALETAMDQAAAVSEAVRSVHFPDKLARVPSLRADLLHWCGGDKRAAEEAAANPSEAARTYATRVAQLGASQDAAQQELLIAHAYTRYLGDLSGGQIIKRRVMKALPVGEGGEGVLFYQFDAVPDRKAFKEEYRGHLDSVRLPKERAQAVVDEANAAFAYNGSLFAAIDARGEAGQPLEESAETTRPAAEGAQSWLPAIAAVVALLAILYAVWGRAQ